MEQKLVVSRSALEAIEADVRARYPDEAYGFLIGRGGMARRIVEGVVAGTDKPAAPGGGFMIPPAEMARAERGARARDRDLVGVYHAAVDREARPAAGAVLALWEGYSYFVVAVADGAVGEHRSFEKYGDQLDEERVEVTDD